MITEGVFFVFFLHEVDEMDNFLWRNKVPSVMTFPLFVNIELSA